tara:strand:+ start:252 stop:1118 length:867 start_codon:yes stop_codon:yes gene_type:complete
MTITSTQIVLYISFISCIILISYYYKINNHNEPFITNDNNNNNNTEANISLEEEKLDNELETNDIKDIETKTKMIKYFTEFQSMLNHADDMDAPITLNNNGNECEPWGDTYADGKYKNYNNNCIKLDGSTKRQCLSNNVLTSCSRYYKNGKVEKLSKVNTNDIMDNMKYHTIVELKEKHLELKEKHNDIEYIVSELISKRNLENQQLYFIDYNNNNLEDKKTLYEKTNTEFERAENDVNINKVQFQDFLVKKESVGKQLDTYYTYTKWLIIFLIIVGLLNFMFSDILE